MPIRNSNVRTPIRKDHDEEKTVSEEAYREHLRVVQLHSGALFVQVRLDHCRFLGGDGAAALVLAFVLNLLRLKDLNPADRKRLKRDGLWFKCPANQIQQQLGMTEKRQQRALRSLEGAGLVATDRRAGNLTWVRVNTEALEEVERLDRDEQEASKDPPRNPPKGGSGTRQRGDPEPAKGGIPYVAKSPTNNPSKVETANAARPKPGEKDSPPEEQPAGEKPPLGQWVERLLKAASRKAGRQIPVKDKGSWFGSFTLFHRRVGGDTARIEAALAHYEQAELLRQDGTPLVLTHPAQLENCLDWIERDMRRSAPPPAVEASKEARGLASRLEELHWPKGSASQLPAACQQSLDAYRRFRKDVRSLASDPSLNGVRSFANYLLENLHSHPEDFVRCWFEEQNGSVQGWAEWSGRLEAFSPGCKRFRKQASDLSSHYSGKAADWDALLKALERKGVAR